MTQQLETGLVHLHYGMGARKTTAMFGLVVRALGHQLRPYIIQFLKQTSNNGRGWHYGEITTLTKALHVPVRQYGKPEFIMPGEPQDPGDKVRSLLGLEHAREIISSGEYDLVILDEILDAISLHHLEMADVIQIIASRPSHVEILLSGHLLFPELAKISDYVTEFREIKHPYQKGILARKGIEF